MLNDTALLRAVRHCVLMMQALSSTLVRELHHAELTSAVSAKCLQLEAGLTLRPCLDVLDGSHCTILGRNRDYPYVTAEIIHK
jgi:hypothetical protein